MQGNTISLGHIVAAQNNSGNGALVQFLFLGLIIVAFYFFLIRPQRNRQRQQLQMQSALVPGQRVMTTAGMYATVVAVEDDAVVLEVAPGVESRYTKQAIMRILDGTMGESAETPETTSTDQPPA